ncbi:hypothetical protein GS636_11780 [Ruegeria sp. HKCCD4884]|uniref:hypothetical protein n=1 Tax=Ruegeria sp. HKCCD4884 TaxID=2683022 RepID=UPI001490A29A|nr:hypothetical protein [Ruegeria sp. HKCCD4884]NOD93466.1 hypothetical protein [Ruegeria sp. HKCCD4884]
MDGARVLRVCELGFSAVAAGFDWVADAAGLGEAALRVRGAGFARVDTAFSNGVAVFGWTAGVLATGAAARAGDFFAGVALTVEDEAGVAFRAAGFAGLATGAAGFSSVLACGAGFGAGLAFTTGSTFATAAARGLAENSTGFVLGAAAITFFTGFFATVAFLVAGFCTREAAGLALEAAGLAFTVGFLTGFSATGAGADAAACSACTGAIGNSNAERATICMIFI